MNNGYIIVDAHLHSFNKINGFNANGPIWPLKYGEICDKMSSQTFMPPYFKKTEFDIDTVLHVMDKAGVDKALLMQNPTIGIQNEEVLKSLQRNPDRFKGTIQVDPLGRDSLKMLRGLLQQQSMKAIKFEMSRSWGWTGIYPGLCMDCNEITSLLSILPSGFLVVLDTGEIGSVGYQIDAVDKLSRIFPEINFLIEHLAFLSRGDLGNEDHLELWKSMVTICKKSNVYIGISAAGYILEDEYPCPKTLKYIRYAKETIGAEKILWGSDLPGTLCQYTYMQMINSILLYADFLDKDEKALILGENALRLLWE